jgi:hypothetical protein
MSKRKGAESKGPDDVPLAPAIRTRARTQENMHIDTAQKEREVAELNRWLAPHRKAWCSHCGKNINFETYTSRFSTHYSNSGGGFAGDNWDLTAGRWKTTINDMPLKPIPDHDGLSIHTRLMELRDLDEPASRTGMLSHLVEPTYMHGHHQDIDPANSRDYNDDAIDTESDDNYDYDDGDEAEEDEIKYREAVEEKAMVGVQFEGNNPQELPHDDDVPRPPAPSEEGPDLSSTVDPFYLLLRAWKSSSGLADTDFTTLLRLLKTLESVPDVAHDVPTTSLHIIDTKLGISKDLFDSICVCEHCGRLYDREQCEIVVGKDKVTRSRVCCKKPLLQRNTPNSSVWTPVLTYPCVDVETALSTILCRQGVDEQLDHWKRRSLPKGTYGDLYEGDVWGEFQKWKDTPFLSRSGIALMLNMDGFQPFKRRQYSVQGIYLAIMNLPRHLRYRRENMILVGLVPGGKEKIPLDHFIERLAIQLNELWVQTSVVLKRRVALLAIACDVPAGRKLCGFMSHSSPRGCSRCDCLYETEASAKGGPPNIRWDKPINSDEGEFSYRTRAEHKIHGKEWRSSKTKVQQNDVGKNTGYKWSHFLLLEYFDPSRMTVLDPLHNVWEGLFKDLLKQFVESTNANVMRLSTQILTEFENEVRRCRFPRSMGPVLGKIGHKMSRFTGHELKNMLNTFFLWLVDGSVNEKQYQLVSHLHEASRIADERVVTDAQIDDLEAHLKEYCTLYAEVYGGNALKPNHHFCRHLGGFMRDYGPTCAFWLFAFERYNGIMTSLNTRASVVEISMFRQYSIHSTLLQGLTAAIAGDLECSQNLTNRLLNPEELAIASRLLGGGVPVAYCSEMTGTDFGDYRLLSLRGWNADTYWKIRGENQFPGFLIKPRESFITKDEAKLLRSSLTSLHKNPRNVWVKDADFTIGPVQKYRELDMCGTIYQSGTSASMSHVLFKSTTMRPALVRYYCSVSVSMDTSQTRQKNFASITDYDALRGVLDDCPWYAGFNNLTFYFARVDWFPEAAVGKTRKHYEKWGVDLVREPRYAFVPVARIVSGFVPLLGSSTTVFSCGPLRSHLMF